MILERATHAQFFSIYSTVTLHEEHWGSGGIDAMSVNSDDILLPDKEDRVMKFFLNIPELFIFTH